MHVAGVRPATEHVKGADRPSPAGFQLFVNDSSWESARFLELIPQTTGQSAVAYSELELAHSFSVAELKIQKLRSELSR